MKYAAFGHFLEYPAARFPVNKKQKRIIANLWGEKVW
jgi:hypothetical protein